MLLLCAVCSSYPVQTLTVNQYIMTPSAAPLTHEVSQTYSVFFQHGGKAAEPQWQREYVMHSAVQPFLLQPVLRFR